MAMIRSVRTDTLSWMETLREAVSTLVGNMGWSNSTATLAEPIMLGLAVLLLAVFANWFAKRIFLTALHRFVRRTRTDWDDELQEESMFEIEPGT